MPCNERDGILDCGGLFSGSGGARNAAATSGSIVKVSNGATKGVVSTYLKKWRV